MIQRQNPEAHPVTVVVTTVTCSVVFSDKFKRSQLLIN